MARTRVAITTALLCAGLLGACGSDDPTDSETTGDDTTTGSETTDESAHPGDNSDNDTDGTDSGGRDTDGTGGDGPGSEGAGSDGGDRSGEDATPDEDDVSAGSEEQDQGEGGARVTGPASFSAPTMPGDMTIEVDVPDGWEAFGVEEAFTDYDLVTLEAGDIEGDDFRTIVVTDQNLGIDAQDVYDLMFEAYATDEDFSEVTQLDPADIDGSEFHGLEAVATMSSGQSRVQYWFGDVGESVLGIYVYSAGTEQIPDEMNDIRDSIVFVPAQ